MMRAAPFQTIGRRMAQGSGLAALLAGVFVRSVGKGLPAVSLDERLAMLPVAAEGLGARQTIRVNDQHVPLVEAASERDGALGLGIVHGHLRLAQMELMRRAATGRMAEVLGRAAVELDQLLRLIDFPRATVASLEKMPAETRAFVDAFADGITAASHAAPPPPEFEILGIEREPWTAVDLFAVSRLCSADYSWKVWRSLNQLRDDPAWAELWADLVGMTDEIPVGAETVDEGLATAFAPHGSNALALSGRRTASGAPILACDPHLLVTTPSLWLIAGLKTPELSVWGLMLPGVPMFGVGRNAHGAWGGTNLHATSSELVDVAGEALTERTDTIALRGGGERTVRLRQSRLGPIISDAKPFAMGADTVALHWLGHRASDEFTPCRNLMKARDWASFEAALDGYGLPGLNMLWAGADGSIGKMIAAHIPRRPLGPPDDIVIGMEAAHEQWVELLTGKDLPQVIDPPCGFVTSANEAPVDPPVTISLYFAAPNRVERLAELIGTRNDLTVDTLAAFQQDVTFGPARALAQRLVAVADEAGLASAMIEALRGWDGAYSEQSDGACAFELIVAQLIPGLERRTNGRIASPSWVPFARLTRLVERAEPTALAEELYGAVRESEALFQTRSTWGEMHFVHLRHPFGRLPWLARRVPRRRFPSGGSNDTLMKSMHPATQAVHETHFAANARFIADLADPDATFATLLGGQDGWLGSSTMFAMVDDWRAGEAVRLPMSEDAIRTAFPHTVTVDAV